MYRCSVRGAEADVALGDDVRKARIPKSYRHPELDERLRTERTRAEARLLNGARKAGVPTPLVRDADVREATLTMQRVGDADLATALTPERAWTVGRLLARLHDAGIVHGDPTTRNVRVRTGSNGDRDADASDAGATRPDTFLIDFGLGFQTDHVEDYAMDLHVFAGSVEGTADEPERVVGAFESGYAAEGKRAGAVLDRLAEVRDRGRYQ